MYSYKVPVISTHLHSCNAKEGIGNPLVNGHESVLMEMSIIKPGCKPSGHSFLTLGSESDHKDIK